MLRRALTFGIVFAVAASTAACASSRQLGKLRFVNEAPIWQVNDRVDTPTQPVHTPYPLFLVKFDEGFFRRLTRLMDMRVVKPAADVNSLGEVPDSTWFTNRIGVRELSVDEVRYGPNRSGSPEDFKPWTVLGTKVGGASVGFMIQDTRGERYLLKFDAKGFAELETAADVIAQRLLWAAGFNVPEDTIVHLERSDLKLGPKAKVKDPLGNERAMTVKDLNEGLAKVEIEESGRIRGLVSKLLPGKPLGGFDTEGTRSDDPNDTIPHERRRAVRGSAAIFAWLNHTDIKPDNSLDVWQKDSKDAKHHYVVHYLVDFGKALGVLGYTDGLASEGFSRVFGVSRVLTTLFVLGTLRRPWDGIRSPAIQGVGLFESDRYNPGAWTPRSRYLPFSDRDRFDEFWGAKILIRFTPEQIRAAVEQGRYSDNRATEYMIKTLIARQRKTARYWFSKVAPLDRFRVAAAALCFEDLSIRYKLGATSKGSAYVATYYDYAGKRLAGNSKANVSDRGHVCVKGITLGRTNTGYTIVRIDTRRNNKSVRQPVFIHLARHPLTGQLRVIGLDRR